MKHVRVIWTDDFLTSSSQYWTKRPLYRFLLFFIWRSRIEIFRSLTKKLPQKRFPVLTYLFCDLLKRLEVFEKNFCRFVETKAMSLRLHINEQNAHCIGSWQDCLARFHSLKGSYNIMNYKSFLCWKMDSCPQSKEISSFSSSSRGTIERYWFITHLLIYTGCAVGALKLCLKMYCANCICRKIFTYANVHGNVENP